jgi:hypothetical protein
MKRSMLLFACLGALACAADLSTARTVYVLSMSRGLDQYLVNRLTSEHVFQVVTDPKLADVIFTDHVGEAFQAQLELISPTPVPEEEEDAPAAKTDKAGKGDKPGKTDKADTGGKAGKADKADKGGKADKGDKDPDAAGQVDNPLFTKPVNALVNPALTSTFGRNKGTLFLVDAKSREVVWSVYDPPKTFSGKEMDHTASDIVNRLKKDLNPKKDSKQK